MRESKIVVAQATLSVAFPHFVWCESKAVSGTYGELCRGIILGWFGGALAKGPSPRIVFRRSQYAAIFLTTFVTYLLGGALVLRSGARMSISGIIETDRQWLL